MRDWRHPFESNQVNRFMYVYIFFWTHPTPREKEKEKGKTNQKTPISKQKTHYGVASAKPTENALSIGARVHGSKGRQI